MRKHSRRLRLKLKLRKNSSVKINLMTCKLGRYRWKLLRTVTILMARRLASRQIQS